jgi:hypothetical protein
MATKKTAKKTTKKKAAKKATKKIRFEGPQALLPGHKPRKAPKAGTYTAQGVDGVSRVVEMPAASDTAAYAYRRRPASMMGVRTYTARMELRLMPDQATAWDRVAIGARLSRAEWIREVCDAAVIAAGGGK